MIKLVKLIADAQGQDTDIDFVLKSVSPKKDSYTLLGTEEECTTLNYLLASVATLKIDLKSFRTGLMRLEQNAGGFANLTSTEKNISASYFATAPANVNAEFPNIWDRVNNGLNTFHTISMESRERRLRWCETLIYNTVMPIAADVIIDKIIAPVSAGLGSLWSNYVRFGREGTVNGNPEGLFDYVNSQATTSFENAGLLEDITGNMVPGTILEAELITRINDCLEYGIFYKG